MSPQTYGQMIFSKNAKKFNGNNVRLTKAVGETGVNMLKNETGYLSLRSN